MAQNCYNGGMEWFRDGFVISDDPGRVDLEVVYGFLKRAYWSRRRGRDTIRRSLAHSVCFWLFEGDTQIGMARVVTDRATFAYLCDVFIEDGYRGEGLGKWLLATVLAHPELQGLRRWCLITADAHEFYRPFGFDTLDRLENWMGIVGRGV